MEPNNESCFSIGTCRTCCYIGGLDNGVCAKCAQVGNGTLNSLLDIFNLGEKYEK